MSAIVTELESWLEGVLRYAPGRMGNALRYKYYKRRLRACGGHIHIDVGIVIKGMDNIQLGTHLRIGQNTHMSAIKGGFLRIGDYVGINRNAMINASYEGTIHIGDHCLISTNVVIRSSSHGYDRTDVPIRSQGHIGGKIIIEDDVWIGANAVVLPNVEIGKGTIVAAGAVVTRSFPPYSIVAGVPAKVVRCRLQE